MIKLLISDFDGTLVDTFEANLKAYQEAFYQEGLTLTDDKYRECFGFRFDRFMQAMGVTNDITATRIKEYKKGCYPNFFSLLVPNNKLIELISTFHIMGGKTALASTARKENLMNAINYLGIAKHFDLINAGEDVKNGKPSPEIYLKTMQILELSANEVMIFEDSPIGLEAAKASGANFIPVTKEWFT